MTKFYTLGAFFGYLNFFCQVGINTASPHFSAALDMSKARGGFVAPRINLSGSFDIVTISSPKEGLVVYHTGNSFLPNGYYYYNGVKWKGLKKVENTTNYTSNEINTNILGYYPSGIGSSAPIQMTIDDVLATKIKCLKFNSGVNANNHTYCSYNLSSSINWDTAYKFGKAANGFLLDLTYTEEWNFIKSNFLNITEGNNKNRIWLGFNKVSYPGKMVIDNLNNAIGEYLWISGQESLVNWSNSASAQPPNIWAIGQPDFLNGSGYIMSFSESSSRNWATYDGSTGVLSTGSNAFNFIIIEFLN